MGKHPGLERLKYASTKHGEQCAMNAGMSKMMKLYVANLGLGICMVSASMYRCTLKDFYQPE